MGIRRLADAAGLAGTGTSSQQAHALSDFGAELDGSDRNESRPDDRLDQEQMMSELKVDSEIDEAEWTRPSVEELVLRTEEVLSDPELRERILRLRASRTETWIEAGAVLRAAIERHSDAGVGGVDLDVETRAVMFSLARPIQMLGRRRR